MIATQPVIAIRAMGKRWPLPFDKACDFLERIIVAEQDEYVRHCRDVRDEHWIASFWSEVLGRAELPSHAEFRRPLAKIGKARAEMRAGRTGAAVSKLKEAACDYSKVRRRWVAYRDGIVTGAERSITIMDITIEVLSSTAGGAVKGGKVAKAAASGVLKLYEEFARENGKASQGLQGAPSLLRIATNTVESVATNLIKGALTDRFLKVLAPRLSAVWSIDPALAKEMAKPGFGSRAQKFLTGFVAAMGVGTVTDGIKAAARKAKGRSLSNLEFLELVADEVVAQISISKTVQRALSAYCKQFHDTAVGNLGREFVLRGRP